MKSVLAKYKKQDL